MTNQDKASLIKVYHDLNYHINKLLEEKEKWQTKAEKCTSVITGMPHGSDGENHRELAICNMADCDMRANELIDELYYLRRQIKIYILTTGDKDERLIKMLQVEK